MAKTTELINLRREESEDPQYAVCYARGSTFRKEGTFFRVEKGVRTVVSRVLCIEQHFGRRCQQCPHSDVQVTFRSRGGPDGP